MAATPQPRRYLGKLPSLWDREQVYISDDSIETDIIEGYSVETRRVFFNDIQAITWHRQFSVAGLWVGGISVITAVLIFVMLAVFTQTMIPSGQAGSVLWILFWVVVAPNLPIFLWFMRPYAYVTVFGKRNRALMRWHFRHGKSRLIFEELSQQVGAYQERARAQFLRSSQESAAAALPQPPSDAADPGDVAIPLPPADAADPPPSLDEPPWPLG